MASGPAKNLTEIPLWWVQYAVSQLEGDAPVPSSILFSDAIAIENLQGPYAIFDPILLS